MIFPSISDLTKDKYNRYELVIATAKSARMITDEYVKERETAEKMIAGNKESEKAIFAMIKREFRDEKAVKCAINRLFTGDFVILDPESAAAKRAARAESERLAAERLLAEKKEEVKFDFSDEDEEEIIDVEENEEEEA
ncbi:MAG: hypothetical protein E7671_01845 [Ruminococcaceae bacterium]|nr:hypothetical protein [Oscillospiraceae bacterium]